MGCDTALGCRMALGEPMPVAEMSRVESLSQARGVSLPLSVVMRRAVPPCAGMVKMSWLPVARSLAKAIVLPSGLHSGAVSYDSLVVS